MPEETTFDFPANLRQKQLELLELRDEYATFCETLPWSAVPLEGFAKDEATMGPAGQRRVIFEDSPGYTAEQAEREQQLRERLVELSALVRMHRFWSEVPREDRVKARMALKHAHEQLPVSEVA
ncbi:hypothetical protein [Streptomyces lutosisoli]|uniref:Uncharacterized protein n=1 Tax=Streptomyces lutosisoli TaxID=2665721 RepID=A0ABW2VY72_9ACTN